MLRSVRGNDEGSMAYLGKIDIEKERLFRVGDLDSVSLSGVVFLSLSLSLSLNLNLNLSLRLSRHVRASWDEPSQKP